MSPITISLLLVVFGQMLNAIGVLIDKYIVTSTAISRPSVYTFYVSIMSGVVLLLLPFRLVHLPDAFTLLISFLIGIVFIVSTFLLYSALKIASASDVVPWLSAVSTISTFLLGFFFLHEQLPQSFPFALVLLVIGMLLVGHFRFNAKSFTFILISGTLFGFSVILTKVLFNHVSFIDGFFWSRMGNAISALALLAWPDCRHAVLQSSKVATHATTFLVIFNRILAGCAFLSILYAINIGNASVVNSLNSLQFFFVLLFIFLARKKLPELFHHEFRPGHIAHKVLAMVFIAVGFVVLFL